MSYRDLILRDRPYLYYEFNDWTTVLADSSGNGITGTYVGGDLQGEPGLIVGPGRSIGCTDISHISTSTVATSLLGTSAAFTLEFWLDSALTTAERPWALLSGGQFSGLAIQNYQASNNAGSAVSANNAGYMSVYMENSGSDADAVTSTGTPNLSDGHVHHVVVTRTATTFTQILYIDGEFNVSYVRSGLTGGAATTLVLGAGNTSDTAPYSGFMDEFAIYQYVLTPAQVRAHYLAGKGHGIDQGAAGLWTPRQGRSRR